jgi:hypothetical protein
MDIVASIFAYLGCLAGVLTALAAAVSVLLSAPAPSAAAMTQKAPAVTTSQKHDRLDSEKTTLVVRAPLSPPLSKAPNRRMKELRRLGLQRHATLLADQEHADFETRFMGYVHRPKLVPGAH